MKFGGICNEKTTAGKRLKFATRQLCAKFLVEDPPPEVLRAELKQAFRLFDDDETGKITFKNLKRVAKELGENMTDEEIQEMIDEADRDGDGKVSFEEFMTMMAPK